MKLAEQPYTYEQYDRNKRDYDDLTTLFAEMVDGSMRTPFEYSFDGRELYARDGSAMGREFEKGLETADRIADVHPNLCFEVRRRRSEIDEYHDMLAMAAGNLPNTMVVVSDFPEELMDANEDVEGYNVSRQQAMLRILAWDGQRMKMYSQSLDRSDREALEAICHSLGYIPQAGELLGQRMHKNLDAAEQVFLVDKLMGIYDRKLQEKYDGRWHAGRQENMRLNTYDFVRAQHDIIQYAMQEKQGGSLDIYKVAAVLEERYQTNSHLSPAIVVANYASPFHDLNREMLEASWRARAVGKVFSACGVSVEASNEPAGVGTELSVAGYGNKTSEATNYKFDKRMHCVVCQAPPKKGDSKKMCGPCGICRSCDKALSKKS